MRRHWWWITKLLDCVDPRKAWRNNHLCVITVKKNSETGVMWKSLYAPDAPEIPLAHTRHFLGTAASRPYRIALFRQVEQQVKTPRGERRITFQVLIRIYTTLCTRKSRHERANTTALAVTVTMMLTRPPPYHYCFRNCLDWMEYAGVRGEGVGATSAVADTLAPDLRGVREGGRAARLPPGLNLYFTRFWGQVVDVTGKDGAPTLPTRKS